jgi:hypothetical protein
VSYFRDHYLPLSRAEKNRLTASFLDHVFPFIVDPSLRAVFCSSTPGIDWQTVEKRGQTVILDFRNVIDPETKRFSMLWIFLSLYEFLKQRGRKDFPFVVTIDEFAALTQQVTGGVNPLAVLLDEFINQYMRNNNIWLTVAHQSIYQVDEQLRHTLLSLGNYVFGRVAKMDEARVLADALFAHDPYRVKRYHNVWGHADVPPISLGNVILNDDAGYFVLERVPEYMQLSEQLELSAQKLTRLGMFEFLLRPATREGEVSQSIIPISIADYLRDTENGELQFPDQAWVNRYRASLAARSGIPVATILREQEQRLMQGTIQEQQGHVPLAGEPVVIAVPMPDVAHPVPQNARETPSLPTLDEQQMAMLSFLIANPDTPVSQLAKELRVGAAQGTEIRESLKAQGLLAELEVRTGRIGAGRPTKFVIPTFAALELFGKDPPSGRGGVIHRSLQHTVMEGAIAKGYSAYCEKDLGNGGIVDVHLEKGTVRIAVEIAIASRPELELSHIKHCLSFGYDQVFGLFADENLLERAAQLLGERFSEQEAGKVRLLPLRKLSHVGQDNGTSSLANNLSLNK